MGSELCQYWQDVTELHQLCVRCTSWKGVIWTMPVAARHYWATPAMARHKQPYAHCGKGWSELCQSWLDISCSVHIVERRNLSCASRSKTRLSWALWDISSPTHIMEMDELSFASRDKTWLICASHGYRHKLTYAHHGKGWSELCRS